MLHAVYSLLEIETPLRAGGWSAAKFAGGRQINPNEEDGEYRDNLARVDATIKNVFFWGYAHMLDLIAWMVLHVMAWCEDCACHPLSFTVDGCSRRDRRTLLQKRLMRRKCPMNTRKACYCAAGEIMNMLSRFLATTHTALLAKLATMAISIPDRTRILNDFSAAR